MGEKSAHLGPRKEITNERKSTERKKRGKERQLGWGIREARGGSTGCDAEEILSLPCVLPLPLPVPLTPFSPTPSVSRLGSIYYSRLARLFHAGHPFPPSFLCKPPSNPLPCPLPDPPLPLAGPLELSLFSERVQRHPRDECESMFSKWMVAEIDPRARSRARSRSPG